MSIECERMHIDTADNVTMASEAIFAACPISSLGLVFLLPDWTLATFALFRASRALDASLCRFLGDVVDVLAIFPQGHPLVMVTPPVWGCAHHEDYQQRGSQRCVLGRRR